MGWFSRSGSKGESRIPEGLWVMCDGCRETLYSKDLEKSLHVCPRCGHHHKVSARTRLAQLFDEGHFKELSTKIHSVDALSFVDTKPYAERIKGLRDKGLKDDAVVVGFGRLAGIKVVVAAMEYAFMGGSMGSAVGEKLARATQYCVKYRVPLIIVSCSGGARMQEGVLSLMQMAKVSAGLARMHKARQPYISILADPTTGGVTASYAMLGDINIGEPGALIGFAGPRVIEQTIRQKLPDGFQRSEFLLEHGMLDLVVPRPELKETLARCLGLLSA
jgi:acetyl-CoA carboxylase carboxyl transferase subunit beta